jgi:hypothetical protein
MEKLENKKIKKEIPPELEVDFLIDNYGQDNEEQTGKTRRRLEELLYLKPKLLEECIEKLDGETGDLKLLRNRINDQSRSFEERSKLQKELKNKKELLDFLKHLQ